MTKPSNVSEEVWEKAKVVWNWANEASYRSGRDAVCIIASALMDGEYNERKACAEVAQRYQDHPNETAAFIGVEIAGMIRSRTHNEVKQ